MKSEAQVAYEVARDGIVVESFSTYYEAVTPTSSMGIVISLVSSPVGYP